MRKSFNRSAKWILGVVTVAMLVTAFTGIGANIMGMRGVGGKGPVDPVVATVNGTAITRSEFDQQLNQVHQMASMEGQRESVLDSGNDDAQALNQLITRDLFLGIAAKQGITASSSEVQAARTQLLPNLRQHLGLPANASQQDVDNALQKYNNQTTEQLYPDSILRPQVILQKYQQAIQRNTKVSDQDVTAFYRQSHIRHILISDKSRSDVQAQALANHVLDKLKAGGNFADLVKQYSEDPMAKFNKGDDGWIGETMSFPAEFMKAALSLQANQTAPAPVYSPGNGYYIIQCLGVKENLPKDYAKNKQQDMAIVAQNQENQQEQQAITAAQATAKITVLDPQLRADRELSLAVGQDASNPVKRNADLAAALTDYQAALPKANFSSQGEIHAQLARIYQLENQPDKEIAELSDAVQSSGTPELNVMLGDLYRRKGDTKDALKQFAQADEAAYDNVQVHAVLQQIYGQMKQTKLAANEAAWVANYNKQQQQAMASTAALSRTPGAPGTSAKPAVTVTPGPGGKGMILQPSVKKTH